jgi:F420-dependent oxidoreductase-like protein
MRFGFWVDNDHEWSEILASARRVEAAGWDGVWFADHFMPFQGDLQRPIHEVWSVLSALAAVTERVRLGSLVCGNTYRNPAVLAKQAVTADHISRGRIVLGLGAGWQDNEHTAYGLDFGTFTDRFERLEEALQILRGLRDEPTTSFAGDWYRCVDAPLSPKPVGPLPILVGGGGEEKTLRMVATYADAWNVWADPARMAHKSAVLDRHCEEVGRDPGEIERTSVAMLVLCDTEAEAAERRGCEVGRPSLVGTVGQLQDQLAELAEIGVDEVIVPDFNLGEGAERHEIADRFLTEVAAPFRSA